MWVVWHSHKQSVGLKIWFPGQVRYEVQLHVEFKAEVSQRQVGRLLQMQSQIDFPIQWCKLEVHLAAGSISQAQLTSLHLNPQSHIWTAPHWHLHN